MPQTENAVDFCPPPLNLVLCNAFFCKKQSCYRLPLITPSPVYSVLKRNVFDDINLNQGENIPKSVLGEFNNVKDFRLLEQHPPVKISNGKDPLKFARSKSLMLRSS